MPPSRIFAATAIAIALAACSSSKPETSPAPAAPNEAAPGDQAAAAAGDTAVSTEVVINAINDRSPPQNYTLIVVGSSIGRQILGDLPPNRTKGFTFRPGSLNGYYKLIAQAPSGAELPSQTFNLTPSLRYVQWTLSTNSILQYATPR
jgi:hypothetical protein